MKLDLFDALDKNESEFINSELLQSKIIEAIVAFSNSKGGYIYIGVNSKGKIIGVNPLLELNSFENEIVQNIIGTFNFEFSKTTIKHLTYLTIKVEESTFKNIKYKYHNELFSYIRVEDENIKTPKIIKQIWTYLNSSKIQFEENRFLLNLLEEKRGYSLNQIHQLFSEDISKIDDFIAKSIIIGSLTYSFKEKKLIFFKTTRVKS